MAAKYVRARVWSVVLVAHDERPTCIERAVHVGASHGENYLHTAGTAFGKAC